MATSACRSIMLSMPSATAALPKRCARSIAVWQIAALFGSVAQFLTKELPSLSSAKGKVRRLETNDSNRDATLLEPRRQCLRKLDVLHDLIFRDLDDQSRPGVGLRPVLRDE